MGAAEKTKNFMFLALSLFCFCHCAHSPSKASGLKENQALLKQLKEHEALVQQVDPHLFYKVQDSVFEVLILKDLESSVILDRGLPKELLPLALNDEQFFSVGTAFSVEEGYFLSAAHVFRMLSSPKPLQYFIRNIRGQVFPVDRVTKYHTEKNIIEFTVAGFVPRNFLNMREKVQLGERVYTAGNAFGHGISVRGGVVASYSKSAKGGGSWENIRYTAPSSPGNSGGPLLDDLGQVVGVVLAKRSEESLQEALPVEELKKIPRNKGFLRVKGTYKMKGLQSEDTLEKELSLDKKLSELSKEIYQAHSDFYRAMHAKHLKEHSVNMFPAHQSVESFLAYQQVSRHWSKVEKNIFNVWGNDLMPYEEIVIGGEESVEVSVPDSFKQDLKESLVFKMGAIYKKAEGTKLKEILENPLPVINKIAKAAKLQVHLGGQFYLVQELKEEDQNFQFEDNLGRPWNAFLWRNALPEVSIFALCTPNPGGLFCQTGFLPTLFEVFAFWDRLKADVNQWMVSYGGSVSDWQEFLSLEKQFLPKVFHHSKVKLSNRLLTVDFGQLKLSLKEVELKNEIIAYTRFGLENPYQLTLTGLGLREKSDDSIRYVLTFKKPVGLENEEANEAWKESVLEAAPYDGKVFLKNDLKNLRYVDALAPQGRRPAATVSNAELLLRFFCESPVEVDTKSFEENCHDFKKAVDY